jgi:hypothetical protein
MCSLAVSDSQLLIVRGDGGARRTWAGTWRYTPPYEEGDPVHFPCELLKKEQAYLDQTNPRMKAVPANFRCGEDQPSIAPEPSPTTIRTLPRPTDDCVTRSTLMATLRGKRTVGGVIQALDGLYEQHGGSIGETWHTGPRDLTPGRGGAALIWTNTHHQPVRVLTPGETVEKNVFWVKHEGSWGTMVIYTAVRVPTPGRMMRLCESIGVEALRAAVS